MGLLRTAMVGLVVAMLAVGGALGGPLHDAVEADDVASIDALLAAGADINELNENHETPLFLAAAKYWAIADKLLLRGADPTIRDNGGRTALHAAVSAGNEPVVAMLLGEDGSGTPVRLDIDDTDASGLTPLMVAAEANRGAMVVSLVFYGADKEKTDLRGYSALTIAGRAGNEQVAAILLRMGAACQDVDPAWKAACDERKTALGK